MEEYKGVKFSYRLVDKERPAEELRKYLELDAKLGEYLDPIENDGNMSMRLAEGFLIKCAGARMTELTGKDVSMVVGIEEGNVVATGSVPSSEARMHHEIYNAMPEAWVVLHFHDDRMLEKFEGAAIGPFPYGSAELAEAAGKEAESRQMFMIKEHGFVLIAKDERGLWQRLMLWKKHRDAYSKQEF